MEDRLRTHLRTIRKINQIDENNKLDTTDNEINIYIPTLINWLKRKIKGDGGIRSITYLNKVYAELDKDCNDIIDAKIVIHNNFLLSIISELTNNIDAINRFKKHYEYNANIISDLDCLINDVIKHLHKKISNYISDKLL